MKQFFLLPLTFTLILTSCKNDKTTSAENEILKEDAMEKKDGNTMYIGTYTKKEGHVDGQAEGIYTVYQNLESGNLEFGETVAQVTNPSFVKASSDKKNLYAVSELGSGDGESGFIYSYKIKEDDSLEELGKISTESYAPCYIAEDQSGDFIFVANYMGGVVMMYEKEGNGNLVKKQNITLENPEKSHPHSVNISADNKFVYITDLGNDRIWIYNLNTEEGSLQPHETPFISLKEGAGPRHFAFSENQNYAYSINELNSTLSVFKVYGSGGLEEIQVISALPEDFSGNNSAADIHLHPTGKFIYASNRGHNSIASFKIDNETGELSVIGFTSTEGDTPRNFAISEEGDFIYVANQDSGNITIFEVDSSTGELRFTGNELKVKTPVCIEVL